jgi:hypothetical protein
MEDRHSRIKHAIIANEASAGLAGAGYRYRAGRPGKSRTAGDHRRLGALMIKVELARPRPAAVPAGTVNSKLRRVVLALCLG